MMILRSIPSKARMLLAPHRVLLATLRTLFFLLITTYAPASLAQQPEAAQPITIIQQPATTTPPAPRPSATTPGNARPADASSKKTPVVLGSISGRVTGEGGEPLAGVWVTLFARTPGSSRPRNTTTDDEGNFKVEGIEPGVYGVGASIPGYVTEIDPLTGRTGGAYRPGDTANVRLVKGGVITGTATDALGEPLVALNVRAHRVRDHDGRTTFDSNFVLEDRTDDRGVYRIYGMRPGIYVVVAGGASRGFGPGGTAYDLDAPTFYPSATRDTASEITVRAGQEVAGIDVRYREEQGHRITGRIESPAATAPDLNASVGVTLTYASTGINAGNSWSPLNTENSSFSLEAIADGEYDLQASGANREGLTFVSAPQRISVRGSDVTGLTLKLTSFASVSGTLVIEPSTEAERAREGCKDRRASNAPQETLLTLLADRPAASKDQPTGRNSSLRDAAPDATGAFTLRNLEAGRYRIAARPLDENLFVRSIQLPGANASTAAAATSGKRAVVATTQPATATRDALDIKAGQQLSGIVVKLAEGASVLSGRVVATEGAATPPYAQLRVHLLPAERERADDALHFFETTPTAEGSFNFKNLPPGRYFVIARLATDASDAAPRPVSWDTDSRSRLRRDAESAATTVELQPCQRTNDFTVRFPSTTNK